MRRTLHRCTRLSRSLLKWVSCRPGQHRPKWLQKMPAASSRWQRSRKSIWSLRTQSQSSEIVIISLQRVNTEVRPIRSDRPFLRLTHTARWWRMSIRCPRGWATFWMPRLAISTVTTTTRSAVKTHLTWPVIYQRLSKRQELRRSTRRILSYRSCKDSCQTSIPKKLISNNRNRKKRRVPSSVDHHRILLKVILSNLN